MGIHNLTLPVLFCEAPPAGLQVAHRRSIPQKCHLKFILGNTEQAVEDLIDGEELK